VTVEPLVKGRCEMGFSLCSCSKSRPVKTGRWEILPLAIRAVEQIITGGNRIRFSPLKPNRSSTSTRGQRISQQAPPQELVVEVLNVKRVRT
jgi:hypothetical protein